jgi:CBS domain-containing protein
MDMRAGDIMTRDVITVRPETSVHDAITLLTSHAIASLPVVVDGEVIGIVSEPDLLKGRLPLDLTVSLIRRPDGPDPGRTVDDVMNEPVICLPPTADAAEVARILLANHVRAVPIVDGTALVGIVSRRDLLRIVQRDDAILVVEVRTLLADYTAPAPVPRDLVVSVDGGVVTVAGTFIDERAQAAVSALVHCVPGVVRVHIAPA